MHQRIHTAIAALKGYPVVSAEEDIEQVRVTQRRILEDARKMQAVMFGLFQQLHQYRDFLYSKATLDYLAEFIGRNYREEIQRGEHAQFKTAADAAIHYLAKSLSEKGRVPVIPAGPDDAVDPLETSGTGMQEF